MTHQTIIFENIQTAVENGVMTITINREGKLNALTIDTLQEIKHAIQEAEKREDVSGIILTGAGPKAFAAGADISEFAHFGEDQATRMSADGHEVMNTIENSEKPVIAAVNGFALGGGCELAMACHMRVASENAKFGQPEVNLGVPPGYGGTQRLIQLVGKGKAIELLLTGDAIDAQTAFNLGLVNYVVNQENLLDKCREILAKTATKSPVAVAKVIRCVNDFFRPNVNGMQREIYEFGEAFVTEDFKEGTDAFLNKRKPNFPGK
jgi:enoyl-CoA hydratase